MKIHTHTSPGGASRSMPGAGLEERIGENLLEDLPVTTPLEGVEIPDLPP